MRQVRESGNKATLAQNAHAPKREWWNGRSKRQSHPKTKGARHQMPTSRPPPERSFKAKPALALCGSRQRFHYRAGALVLSWLEAAAHSGNLLNMSRYGLAAAGQQVDTPCVFQCSDRTGCHLSGQRVWLLSFAFRKNVNACVYMCMYFLLPFCKDPPFPFPMDLPRSLQRALLPMQA